MEPHVRVHRHWQDTNQSSGVCTVVDFDGFPLFSALSLERGWRNNESMVSCVPLGEYDLVYEWSNKFNMFLWEIKGVPNRSEAKFHSANYWTQLHGCIALGLRYLKINKDEYRDLTSSKATMQAFHTALKGYTKVKLFITAEPFSNIR